MYDAMSSRSIPVRCPPLTTSQVDLLKVDNVASGILPGFVELNIQPEAIEEIVPTYIGRSRMPDRANAT